MHKLKPYFKKVVFIQKKYKLISNASLLFLVLTGVFLRSENKEIYKILNDTQKELIKTKGEVKFLKANVISYNRSLENFPFPIWQKKKVGGQFVMQYLNTKYVDVFGHIFNYNIYNVIGKNNFQLGYPKKVAQNYYENDIAVSIIGNSLRTVEPYIDSLRLKKRIKVVKWRELRGKDTLVNGMVYEFLDDE